MLVYQRVYGIEVKGEVNLCCGPCLEDLIKRSGTVDGSEIRRSPVDMVNIPVIYKVLYIPVGDRRISEPSTVCDFPSLTFVPRLDEFETAGSACVKHLPSFFPHR